MAMTEAEKQTLRDLRSRGYLVITWTPEEIGTADFQNIEDSVVSYGNEIIEDSQGETDDTEADC